MTDNPRFYTTSIDAAKTANEIGEIVRQYGARLYGVEFTDNGEPEGLHFVMEVPAVGEVPVLLQAQVEGLARRLDGDREQARRVAWRQLKSYVEMTLELVENGVKQFHEVFLGDVVLDSGRRIAEEIEHSGRLPSPHRDDQDGARSLPGGREVGSAPTTAEP